MGVHLFIKKWYILKYGGNIAKIMKAFAVIITYLDYSETDVLNVYSTFEESFDAAIKEIWNMMTQHVTHRDISIATFTDEDGNTLEFYRKGFKENHQIIILDTYLFKIQETEFINK